MGGKSVECCARSETSLWREMSKSKQHCVATSTNSTSILQVACPCEYYPKHKELFPVCGDDDDDGWLGHGSSFTEILPFLKQVNDSDLMQIGSYSVNGN